MRVVASREEAWVVARKEDAGVAGMAVEGAMLAMVMPEERVVREARQAADCMAARRVERTVVAARAASMAMVAVLAVLVTLVAAGHSIGCTHHMRQTCTCAATRWCSARTRRYTAVGASWVVREQAEEALVGWVAREEETVMVVVVRVAGQEAAAGAELLAGMLAMEARTAAQ